jgi:uncharacterized membrane protein HdeD (DUF308 family)
VNTAISSTYTVDIGQHRWLFILLGVAVIVAGIWAIIHSRTATQIAIAVFGWLLLFSGAVLAVSAFFVGSWGGFFLMFFAAVLTFIVGFLFVSRPLLSAEAVTIVMAFYYLVTGIFFLIAPIFSHIQGWGWLVFYGIVNIILGSFIFRMLPAAALFIIGLFLGIDLLLGGAELIALGISAPTVTAGVVPVSP